MICDPSTLLLYYTLRQPRSRGNESNIKAVEIGNIDF